MTVDVPTLPTTAATSDGTFAYCGRINFINKKITKKKREKKRQNLHWTDLIVQNSKYAQRGVRWSGR